MFKEKCASLVPADLREETPNNHMWSLNMPAKSEGLHSVFLLCMAVSLSDLLTGLCLSEEGRRELAGWKELTSVCPTLSTFRVARIL